MDGLKERIREKLGDEPTLSGLATITTDGRPWVRYVMARTDGDLNVWFCTHLCTRKVEHIRNNPAVHLHTGVSSVDTAQSYLQIEGTAEIFTDPATRAAHWSEMLKPYFSGVEDPNFCVCRIRPARIEVWGMTPGREPEVWTA